MSVKCVAWVFHESLAVGNDRLVLLAIADEADNDGLNAFPSVELLADKARLNTRTVRRSLARLEGAGELLIRRPDHPGRGRHNRYTLTMGRDPDAVAGSLGWPNPKLDPDVARQWAVVDEPCQTDPLRDGPQPGHKAVDNTGEKGRIPDTSDRKGGACVSADPKTLNDTGRALRRTHTRRRGLDPQPDDERVTASMRRAAAGAAQARATAALPRTPAAVLEAALADARARLDALHAGAAAAGVTLDATGGLHTPNELDDRPPEDDPELDEHDPRPDDDEPEP